MLSSDTMRGYHDIMILSLLAKEDSYGYEISKNISLKTNNMYNIKETTLYSAISRLERHRFITSYKVDETKGRERTYYRISEQGRMYLQEKEDEFHLIQSIISNFVKGDNL